MAPRRRTSRPLKLFPLSRFDKDLTGPMTLERKLSVKADLRATLAKNGVLQGLTSPLEERLIDATFTISSHYQGLRSQVPTEKPSPASLRRLKAMTTQVKRLKRAYVLLRKEVDRAIDSPEADALLWGACHYPPFIGSLDEIAISLDDLEVPSPVRSARPSRRKGVGYQRGMAAGLLYLVLRTELGEGEAYQRLARILKVVCEDAIPDPNGPTATSDAARKLVDRYFRKSRRR